MVTGLETLAVLALDAVDGSVVVVVVTVNLDVRLGELLTLGLLVLGVLLLGLLVLVLGTAFLVVVSLLVELARTTVAFLNTDLLFAVALLGTRRLLGGTGD